MQTKYTLANEKGLYLIESANLNDKHKLVNNQISQIQGVLYSIVYISKLMLKYIIRNTENSMKINLIWPGGGFNPHPHLFFAITQKVFELLTFLTTNVINTV